MDERAVSARRRIATTAQLRGMFRGPSRTLDSMPPTWSRLAEVEPHLIHPELADRAAQLSGVRIALSTNSTEVRGQIDAEPGSTLSLTGPDFARTTQVRFDGSFAFAGLDSNQRTIELWLPHCVPSQLHSIDLSAGATIEAPQPSRFRWVCYGSSISQGNHVRAPHLSWPALASRSLDADLRLLGFAGQALGDTAVAMDIRDSDADLISICLGINTHNAGSSTLRTFWSQVAGFVQTVRERHEDTPLVLISPIASPSREAVPASPRLLPSAVRRRVAVFNDPRVRSVVGPTLTEIRDVVHEIGQDLADRSNGSVTLLDGRELLGPQDHELLVDGLHPGERGSQRMAERFLAHVECTSLTP